MSGCPPARPWKGVARTTIQARQKTTARIGAPPSQHHRVGEDEDLTSIGEDAELTKIPGKSNEEKAGPYAGKAQPPEDTGRQAGKFDHHPFDSLRTEKIG